MRTGRQLLLMSCENRPGIVSLVTAELYAYGFDIAEAQQYGDAESGRFFLRIVFSGDEARLNGLRENLARIAHPLRMEWGLSNLDARPTVIILASKAHHCLADLLYRWKTGELSMDIAGIVSNHPLETYADIDLYGLPFHHCPVAVGEKRGQEQQIRTIIDNAKVDLVILARYMQILSPEFAAYLGGRCINIHHSLLPGFKGAKPYHQAHAHGVKLIGATAHFVTADLDEGPIIEQDVERIGHNDSPRDLVRKGRDIERRVLARAVRYFLEGRVLINGSRTIVFEGR